MNLDIRSTDVLQITFCVVFEVFGDAEPKKAVDDKFKRERNTICEFHVPETAKNEKVLV